MTRHVTLLLALFGAAVCAPAVPTAAMPRSAQAAQQKTPEQKTPEAAASTEKPVDRSTLKIPAEDSKRLNAVKPDADSVAQGKHTFTSQCAMCHGAAGDGKGDLADDMKLKLLDYRDPEALKDYSDGDLFYILSKANEKMPGQGDRMGDPQKWNLVNYIRSFSKKTTAAKKESKP